jgi:hypothetical protein
MPQVLTEGTNLAVVEETTLGASTPPTTGWFNLQPNSYGDFGSSIKKVPRSPISKNRQLQKGMLVDLDSAMPFESDVTKDVIDVFLEGIFMSTAKHSGGTGVALFRPTAVTATGYTVAASGALANNVLVFARGFCTAANNGLKLLAGTSTGTEIKTTGLVAEASPPSNATVEVAGYQGATGDITMDGSGNLTSTTLNFTTLGLNVGQWIWLGGDTATAALSFANSAYRGFARIKTIAANLLTLERRSWTVGALDNGATKTIHIYFSRWCRNVAIDHADFKTPSYAFEVTYPNLGAGPVAEYEYPLGNRIDETVFNLPLASKATVNFGMIGTNTADPKTARETGPSTALNPVTNLGVSTATDIMRLRMSNVDETGISTDFTSLKITLKNNCEPEKQLGTLGAVLINVGKFEVMVEADVIFTSDQVIKGIRDNRTCALDVAMRNADFGALLDVTSMTLDEGDRKFETNKSVGISAKTTGFQDAILGYTASLSVFPYLPSA